MRMSPFWIARPRSLSVWSTAAAGTISQSVRGGLRRVTRSSSEEAATAPVSFAKPSRVLASAQDDAAHRVATAPARGGDDPLAVLEPIKPLDLPDVGLDLRILKLLDGLDHQPGPEFQVIGLRVSPEPIELALFRGHEQLEHESAATLVAQIPGQPLQAIRLPPVQGGIALRVVAHQHLAEGRADDFDVVGEVFAVLEVELLLPALLGGTHRDIAVRLGIAEDGRPELLVHEDARLVSGHAGRHGGREAIIDHPFGGSDLSRLLGGQPPLPAEHPRLERAAVVERRLPSKTRWGTSQSVVPSAVTCSDVLPKARASVWATTFASRMSWCRPRGLRGFANAMKSQGMSRVP